MAHSENYIQFLTDRISGKDIYTPLVVSQIKCGNTVCKLSYRKITEGIEVFIEIDNNPMGRIILEKKKELADFRNSMVGLSSSPYFPIAGGVRGDTDDLWEKQLKFADSLRYRKIEEKITFFTLISLIELYFPTNWLLLLP